MKHSPAPSTCTEEAQVRSNEKKLAHQRRKQLAAAQSRLRDVVGDARRFQVVIEESRMADHPVARIGDRVVGRPTIRSWEKWRLVRRIAGRERYRLYEVIV